MKSTETYMDCNAELHTVPLASTKTVLQPRLLVKHICGISCINWTGYNYNKIGQINPLAIPLHFAFDRCLAYFKDQQKCVWYKTPCGRNIRNMEEMYNYLIITDSSMTIDLFDFSNWINPLSECKVLKPIQFVEDLSAGKESRAITCVNTINNELPPPMEYITVRQPMPGVNINVDRGFLCGCDCTDNCQDKSKCACWQMTVQSQKMLPEVYRDPNIGYDYRRLPEPVLTGIYECNETCKCTRLCLNRVAQHPLSQNLQLFLTEKKGWGVRCLNDIPQGSFICIYVGNLLTETDANKGGKKYGDEYLAELDYIEAVVKIKEDYECIAASAQEDYGSNKNDKNDNQYETLESSDENHQPSEGRNVVSDGKRKKTKNRAKTNKKVRCARNMKNKPKPPKLIRSYFGDNKSMYIIDAKSSGNIARYLNHSCSPNTFVQNVFVDTHDLRYPWISFFALNYIQAGTELTWDYNYKIGNVRGKVILCQCGSNNCRGRLL